MPSDEAACIQKPREKVNSSRGSTGYILAIIFLFFVAAALCANNMIIYKSYVNTKGKVADIAQKVNYITSKNGNLIHEQETQKKEYEDLESSYHTLKDKYETLMLQNNQILKQFDEIKRNNEELARANKDLVGDNIELQNSLKKAASVGIKPQSFTKFDGISSRGDINRGKYIGSFLGTAYTPSNDECGNNKGITNSGKPIIPGISIAIDNRYWPFGTVFYIKGLGYAVAMDTGSAIKGKHRFDFAVFDKKFAYELGEKRWDVYLVKLGNGKVDKIVF